MTKVPNEPYERVVSALQRDGRFVVRTRGSHIRLQKRTRTELLKLTVPAHRPVKRSALRSSTRVLQPEGRAPSWSLPDSEDARTSAR
jgi:predicted RNA binding protein YcfA (HicA-like mRNA interferase family)